VLKLYKNNSNFKFLSFLVDLVVKNFKALKIDLNEFL
jgi:hypothetical protein